MHTIYVLIAVAALAALTYQARTASMDSQDRVVSDEVAVQAMRAVVEALDAAAELPFDGAPAAGGVSALTPAAAFGASGPPADLDDLHGTTRDLAGPGVPLALRHEVAYVAWDGDELVPSALPTALKQLCVTADFRSAAAARLCRTYPLPS